VQALLAQRGIEIELTDRAKDYLADKGYEPTYGARPLKRAIQELLMEPLSTKIISSEVHTTDRVIVDVENDQLTFKAVSAAAA
jgi:ATP-dependent Clp protease ATP-binding subunit ClpB